jgi:site-specific DNA recombinase
MCGYADPTEKNPKKRRILREDLHPVEAEAIRDAARRLLEFGETVRAILKDRTGRGIRPVAAPAWTLPSFVYTMTSPRIAGLREWQGQLYPAAGWPAIIDADTHERLVKHFADPARRQHMVRTQQRLLGGIMRCPKCGHKMYYKPCKGRSDCYACANGPGRGCGGVAIIAQPLEEYVTGAVLDALESPRIQQALAEGADTTAPHRAELLADIKRAQDKREEARQDYSADRIDRADWLDIRDRTEERIKKARHEYDRLAGSVTVLGDIPPAEHVRDAWESWNTDRRRAAIKTVLNAIVIHPHDPSIAPNSIGRSKDPAKRVECNAAMLHQRVEFDWRV